MGAARIFARSAPPLPSCSPFPPVFARLRHRYATDAALLFTVFIWGINFPILKAALAVMHPHALNAFRFTVSIVALGALFALRTPAPLAQMRVLWRTLLPQIVGLGLLGYVAYQLAFIIGINRTTAGNAAIMMASAPLWTAVVGAALGYERLRGLAWAGLVVSLAGTAVVIVGGAREVSLGADTFVGNLIMLLAAFLWGAFTALSRPVLRHITPSALSFLSLLVALPILYGLAGFYLDTIRWEAVNGWVWLAILFSGGLSTGLAVVLWAVGVQQVGASHTAAYSNLVPFIAVVASVVALGEPVTALQLAGGVLIVAGLVVMRRLGRTPTPRPAA